jgi:hypothetical protein
MAADNDGNTGLVLALVGAGAALAWLFWRGRGTGNMGERRDFGNVKRPKVWIGGDERLKVDDVTVDLPTALELVRRAGIADVVVAGNAREGWYINVRDALLTTGAKLYGLPR